ncbi:hypothetical protein [Streptomyces sp. H39-S7]|uniref:hypothetical protein n=1 Tax=Streptomyces sp. H39-S7 TaxID=3004357 RepID=UPI0022AF94B8|nr:hypothetical protein [Streptomyces sp. H39-S7]
MRKSRGHSRLNIKAARQQRQRHNADRAHREAEQAAQPARLQQWAEEEAADAEAATTGPCATADCELPVDWHTDIDVLPEDGLYCGPRRVNQATRNRSLRGMRTTVVPSPRRAVSLTDP